MDQQAARALTDAGYMPLPEYLRLGEEHGWGSSFGKAVGMWKKDGSSNKGSSRMTVKLLAIYALAILATCAGSSARGEQQDAQAAWHSVGADRPQELREPRYHRRSFNRRRVGAASISRDCLHSSARNLLARLEAQFGKVELVSTCRPGARMPSGHASWHARNRAFDFKVPRGVDKGRVMVWLGHNSPGVTMSYRRMAHIHTDTGDFHKVIYNAASHEAGEQAVAIWKARAVAALAPVAPLPRPRPPRATQREILPEDWTALLAESEPGLPSAPEPRNIFLRYVESRDVVVQPWVTVACPGGQALPPGLQRLLGDAAAYFRRTIYINSAYRSPAYNRRVGGARFSQHIQCRAIDFRVAGVPPAELRRWILANLPKWGITGLGTYATHTHVDSGARKAKRLVQWNGGGKRRQKIYAKARKVRSATAL